GNEDFAIDNTGQITVAQAGGLDFETEESYALEVTVSDGVTTIRRTISISVNDVNEAPMFATDVYTQNVAENTAVDAAVVALSATDEDDTDDPTYEITTGNTNDDFKINANTGVIAVAKALTGKVGNSYTLTVTARDDEHPAPLTATATVNITVTENQAPVFTDGSSTVRSVAENTVSGNVGGPVAAADPERDAITYAIKSGNEANNFEIDSSSGQITVKSGASLDHEDTPSYTLTVTATDAGSNTATESTVTITVDDVNEAPEITSDNTKSVAENTTAVLTVVATDADANTMIRYSLSGGADKSSFDIDQNSGALTFNTAPDFEAPGSTNNTNIYVVAVTASDGDNSVSQTITVTVTNDPDDDVLGIPSAEGVELYPNPASGHFRLTGISGQLSGVTLIGTEGKAVRSYLVSKSGLYDLSGLNEGLFFVVIEGVKERKAVGRIVIRK
ncbi:MAG: cadherin domain-containing protein, partial [Ekhidna sp.]|nr:cadherin domain-containing protein [Ekhidna sp.]